jgi:ribosomal protein L22
MPIICKVKGESMKTALQFLAFMITTYQTATYEQWLAAFEALPLAEQTKVKTAIKEMKETA